MQDGGRYPPSVIRPLSSGILKGSKMDNVNKVSQFLDGLLFPKIFRSFRMAIQPSKLIIALSMIAAIALAGWIMDLHPTVVTTPGTNLRETELNIFLTSPDRVKSGVFSTLWGFGRDTFHGVLAEMFAFNVSGILRNVTEYIEAIHWAIRFHIVYFLIFVAIKLCIVSVGGGAICRIAALQFARDEKPGIMEALRFALKRFVSFASTPLIPVGMVIVAGVCITVLGLTANIPFGIGELIVAILTPLALLAGAAIAVISIGAFAGFKHTTAPTALTPSAALSTTFTPGPGVWSFIRLAPPFTGRYATSSSGSLRFCCCGQRIRDCASAPY